MISSDADMPAVVDRLAAVPEEEEEEREEEEEEDPDLIPRSLAGEIQSILKAFVTSLVPANIPVEVPNQS